jgi:hypothetical protein
MISARKIEGFIIFEITTPLAWFLPLYYFGAEPLFLGLEAPSPKEISLLVV